MITVSASDEGAQQVAWKAYDLMWEEQGLRTTTADIAIEAAEGALTLNGRVRTNNLHELAERLARAAIDGWQLHNHLISDEALALALAGKLAIDRRTMDANVRFEVFMGVAYLKGTVRSKEQHAAVLDLAGQVPNILRIEDQLAIVG
jgi:osmotically-inducible protein OsmY